MCSIEARRLSVWCGRIDRALNKLKRNNVILLSVRRKRIPQEVITLVRYDFGVLYRMRHLSERTATSSGKTTRRASLSNSVQGLWEIPYSCIDASSSTISSGLLWCLQIKLQADGREPTVRYSTCDGGGLSGVYQFNLDGKDKVVDKLILQLLESAVGTPIELQNKKQYSSSIKLMNIPEAEAIPALLVGRPPTEKVIQVLENYLGIKLRTEVLAPIVISDIQELPNN